MTDHDDLAPMDYTDETLELPEVLVKMPGGLNYILQAANEEKVIAYRDRGMRAAKFGDEGTLVGMSGGSETQAFFVSLCLFEEGSGRPVPLAVIRTWKPHIVADLFNRLKRISKLDQPDTLDKLRKERARIDRLIARLEKAKVKTQDEYEEQVAGNSQSATLDGST